MLTAANLLAQVETTSGPITPPVWVSHGSVEGHLALTFSSDGAFSADSSRLAVASEEKVIIMPLQGGSAPSVIKPRLQEIQDLEIHSASFVSPHAHLHPR